MSPGGQVAAKFVPGEPQKRRCQCDRPAVLDEGRCVKCGHQHEPPRVFTEGLVLRWNAGHEPERLGSPPCED